MNTPAHPLRTVLVACALGACALAATAQIRIGQTVGVTGAVAGTVKESMTRAQLYLTHTTGINNWDLVDLSAPDIIGDQIMEGNDPTPRLLDSANLWEQRIAVVSTMLPIRNRQFDTALRNVGHLLQHPHDLMRKANGWMLRETGKRDISTLLRFLDLHAATMPRTTLRYAVERLAPEQKKHYMEMKKHTSNSL